MAFPPFYCSAPVDAQHLVRIGLRNQSPGISQPHYSEQHPNSHTTDTLDTNPAAARPAITRRPHSSW